VGSTVTGELLGLTEGEPIGVTDTGMLVGITDIRMAVGLAVGLAMMTHKSGLPRPSVIPP
jgi:hypothetical protein